MNVSSNGNRDNLNKVASTTASSLTRRTVEPSPMISAAKKYNKSGPSMLRCRSAGFFSLDQLKGGRFRNADKFEVALAQDVNKKWRPHIPQCLTWQEREGTAELGFSMMRSSNPKAASHSVCMSLILPSASTRSGRNAVDGAQICKPLRQARWFWIAAGHEPSSDCLPEATLRLVTSSDRWGGKLHPPRRDKQWL